VTVEGTRTDIGLRPNLSDALIARIVDLIRADSLGPGDRLPAVRYAGAYEPSAVLRIPGPGRFEVFAHDETAHLLCHPTNLAFRGRELVVANLGRWHLTGFDLT
jgi:hypothetical protein